MPVSDLSVMNAMKRDGGAAGGSPAGQGGPIPPMTAPMSTPEPKSGNIQRAKVKIGQALDLIEMALPDIGSESPDGQALVAAMRALHKIIGQKRAEIDALQPAEAKSLLQNLPNGGGAAPGVAGMAAAPPVPGMGPTPPTSAGPPVPPAPPSPASPPGAM